MKICKYCSWACGFAILAFALSVIACYWSFPNVDFKNAVDHYALAFAAVTIVVTVLVCFQVYQIIDLRETRKDIDRRVGQMDEKIKALEDRTTMDGFLQLGCIYSGIAEMYSSISEIECSDIETCDNRKFNKIQGIKKKVLINELKACAYLSRSPLRHEIDDKIKVLTVFYPSIVMRTIKFSDKEKSKIINIVKQIDNIGTLNNHALLITYLKESIPDLFE